MPYQGPQGFLELAFALKFLSVADLAYGWHILDREAFVKRFLQARAYFGELAPQFMKESGAILAKIQADRS